jgi:cytochrome c biogenesis protein CcdA
MIELIQIAWDIFMLRDSARKGQLKLRAVLFALAFVVLLYGTGVPAAALYQNHPQYKPLFLATMVFDLVLFVAFMTWAVRYNLKLRRDQRAVSNSSNVSGNSSQG